MKITFNQQFKSIREFNEAEINDFSVFVGINGSGKTHLLKAIKEGSVKIDNLQKEKISYFNFQTFLIKNQKNIAPRNLDDEKLQAWNILVNNQGTFKAYDSQIKAVVGEAEYPYTVEVSDEHKATYEGSKKNISNFIDGQTNNLPKIRKLLKTGIFESKKYATEMVHSDFIKFSNYNPDDYELLESLSEVFIDYKKKLVISGLAKKDGGEELTEETLNKLEQQSPWIFVNNMFKVFGLPHVITFPEFTASDLINSQSVPFQVKLNIDGDEMDFDDLSSGEKILCALAITVYQDNKSIFPDLLLLDEVDASLHPSMIKNLLSVVYDIFMKNGCKVIMATHSPTTVAIVEEGTLFEIQKGKVAEKVKKIAQTTAIDILSEGVMTLEKGLKIFDAIFLKDLTIISEGKNQEHIKKAIKILDDNLTSKIQFYEHDAGSGEADLFGLFEFIKKTKVEKRVLFIWDCDVKNKVDKRNDSSFVFRFCFEKNTSNTVCQNGIENLYDESFFSEDLIKTITITENGGTITRKEFSETNKNKFLEKIQKNTDLSTFSKFIPLITKLKELV
jgi:predicted ATPase